MYFRKDQFKKSFRQVFQKGFRSYIVIGDVLRLLDYENVFQKNNINLQEMQGDFFYNFLGFYCYLFMIDFLYKLDISYFVNIYYFLFFLQIEFQCKILFR